MKTFLTTVLLLMSNKYGIIFFEFCDLQKVNFSENIIFINVKKKKNPKNYFKNLLTESMRAMQTFSPTTSVVSSRISSNCSSLTTRDPQLATTNISGRVCDAMFASTSVLGTTMSSSVLSPVQSGFTQENTINSDKQPDLLQMIIDDEIKNLF